MPGTLVVPNPGYDVYHSFGGAGSASYPLIRVEMAQEPFHAPGTVDEYRRLIASHPGLVEHWRLLEDPSVAVAPVGEVGGVTWPTGETTDTKSGSGTVTATDPLTRDDGGAWLFREGQGTVSSLGAAQVQTLDHWNAITGGTWSIEGWFRLDQREASSASATYRTIAYQNLQFWLRAGVFPESDPRRLGFEFYVRGGTSGNTWVRTPQATADVWGAAALELGKTYHFVCTFDEGASSGTAKLYLNGELVGERTSVGTTDQGAGTDSMIVGSSSFTSALTTGWVGALANLAWYSQVLTEAEVQEHYRVGIEQWVDVTDKVRALEWGAGRPHELQRAQPGYVRAVVDNSDGWFDTTYDGGTFDALGPLAQIRVRSRVGGTSSYDTGIAGTTVDEFRGMVEALPQGWIGGGGHDAVVEFDGYDPLGYLGVADLQLSYEQLVLNDDPVAYWRLNDGQGENIARELVTGGTAYDGTVVGDMNQVGSSYITFGTAGARADAGIDGGDTAAAFDPAGASTYGDRIVIQDADWQDFAEGPDAISIEFWLWQDSVIDGSAIIGKGTAWAVRNALGTIDFGLAQTPWVQIAATNSAVLGTAAWQHVVVVHGGYAGQSAKIYLNGVEQSVQEASGTVGGGIAPIEIGGLGDSGLPDPAVPITGRLDEVAVYAYPLSAEQVKVHYYTGLGQLKSERTDERIDDLLDRALVPRRFRNLEVGQSTLDAGTLSGDTERALAQLQQATQTEDGLIFADRGGTIRFQDRHYRYTDNSGTVAILGDGTVGEIRYQATEGGEDLQNTWNQIEVNSITGGTQVQATDPDSIRQYGPRSFSRDLLISDVSEMQDAAGYLIGRYATPGFRFGQIEFSMARMQNDYQRGIVAGFDLSGRYTVRRRRAGNATGTIERDVFLEGYVHTLIPGGSWKTTLSTSPVNSYEFWVLDESELDSTTRLAY